MFDQCFLIPEEEESVRNLTFILHIEVPPFSATVLQRIVFLVFLSSGFSLVPSTCYVLNKYLLN